MENGQPETESVTVSFYLGTNLAHRVKTMGDSSIVTTAFMPKSRIRIHQEASDKSKSPAAL